MNCSTIQKLIQPHHDGELDAANTLQVDEHLADCPQCFDALRRLDTLRGALQNDALRFSAPAGLRSNIRASIAQTAASEQEQEAVPQQASAPVWARPWFASSGWIAAAIAISIRVASLVHPAHDSDRLVAELTASHVRSLQGVSLENPSVTSHLYDVLSTDQHTVKPWFNGKIDFAPTVRDLRETGFPLLGGRLDFIDGRPAAALVYGRQKHIINLFIWPSKSATVRKLTATQRNGYNVAQWSDGKMEFSAVSDLNETDLRVFVGDFQGR